METNTEVMPATACRGQNHIDVRTDNLQYLRAVLTLS